MLFNSLQYLVFFPAVVLLYFATPQRQRLWLLLAASYYFYMCWKPEYVVLIMASTLLDYIAALGMGRHGEKRGRRLYLLLSLCGNLGLLFAFKYANFAGETLSELLTLVNVFHEWQPFELLLPVGISFYTFQSLSYSLDVYNGVREPERHLGKLAVYVAFFPQLVAGPIERSTRLMPQFERVHRFDRGRLREGATLMLLGFFKKLVIADQVALYVDPVYAAPDQHAGLTLLVASYLFAFQIYCDFSGYSDIAIGSARVLGFDLMENFNRPYYATSIGDFWRRWHISLATWFRDYVHIPLGRVPRLSGNASRLFITWTLIGLWHGAAWHYVAWGVYQAVVMGIEGAIARVRGRAHAGGGSGGWLARSALVFVTFQLTTLGMVLFRAPDVPFALALVRDVFIDLRPSVEALLAGQTPVQLAALVGPIALLLAIEAAQGDRSYRKFMTEAPLPVRWGLTLALVFGIACLGVFDGQDFIYFQF